VKLNLLDIDDFIKRKNLMEVLSSQIFLSENKLDPEGLFSESIFGLIGSSKRRLKFAYINLIREFIHPEAWRIIFKLDPKFSKIISEKEKFDFINGEFIPNENGKTGLSFFINSFKDIDFTKLATKKNKDIDFVKKNLDKILITKFLVLPAGLRDIQLSSSVHTKIQFSDITNLYRSLIQQIKIVSDKDLELSVIDQVMIQVQNILLKINTWFKNRLKGKYGIIRNAMIKKSIDYSGRFVITTDNKIPMNEIGLSWQNLLKLFEPFVLHELFKKNNNILNLIQQNLNKNEKVDIFQVKKFLTRIISDPTIVNEPLKEYFIDIIKKITKDKLIVYKRDPVENRESWVASNIRVLDEGSVLKVNPLNLPRTGGDHDGDVFAVASLFTNEAQQEAKEKLHPFSMNMWSSVSSSNKIPYSIDMDAATAIYAATKN